MKHMFWDFIIYNDHGDKIAWFNYNKEMFYVDDNHFKRPMDYPV